MSLASTTMESRSVMAVRDSALKQSLGRRLGPYGQEHLLNHWEELSIDQRCRLREQLDRIDFERLASLLAGDQDSARIKEAAAKAVPLSRRAPIDKAARQGALGVQALSEGRIGVMIVAGGSGTRLGFNQPKGMFPIGSMSGASLFQVLFEKVLATRQRYGGRIPVYVMTSQVTHAVTAQFLRDHRCFGLFADDVRLFQQGELPAVDAATGRVLLEAPDRIVFQPDGHGGMLEAFDRSGCLADAEQRGIKELFYVQVDNPLAPLCDPAIIDEHLRERAEVSTLAVEKREPTEKLGNLVQVDGRTLLIEYSDFPERKATQRDYDGQLSFWAGSIGVHLFQVAFLRRAAQGNRLPIHFALKPCPCLDSQGRLVHPREPNAIKMERFIFDLLPMARRSAVIVVDRDTCFAPLKNSDDSGSDCPMTVRAQMQGMHRCWLAAAGFALPPHAPVEISPLFAMNRDECVVRLRPYRT